MRIAVSWDKDNDKNYDKKKCYVKEREMEMMVCFVIRENNGNDFCIAEKILHYGML